MEAEYCLISHNGDDGTFKWFSTLEAAQEPEWPHGAYFQTILEYRGGRSKPARTTFRNEWCRGESWSPWRQVCDEDGPLPRQGDIFSPPLFAMG